MKVTISDARQADQSFRKVDFPKARFQETDCLADESSDFNATLATQHKKLGVACAGSREYYRKINLF